MTTLPVLTDTIECSCGTCVSACRKKPGWFSPNEIKPLADYLGITEKELFEKHLLVDYYVDMEKDQVFFVLSPSIKDHKPGQEFPFFPTGSCVFLNADEKCSIHPAKPFECKAFDHRNEDFEAGKQVHFAVAQSWADYKQYITDLLGREPQVQPIPMSMDLYGFVMNSLLENKGVPDWNSDM